jgi:hypothetical protein
MLFRRDLGQDLAERDLIANFAIQACHDTVAR